jgi:hypothetical protein
VRGGDTPSRFFLRENGERDPRLGCRYDGGRGRPIRGQGRRRPERDVSWFFVSGRLKALLLLALAFIKTLLLRPFTASQNGVALFRDNYDADGLPPVTPDERAGMTAFQRCVTCGLCDRGEGERMARSGGAYRGVMALVVAGSRSMPDFRAAAYGFGFVPEEVLLEKERICPVGIPFRRIARFVRDKAAAVGGPLPLPSHVPSLPPSSGGRPSPSPPRM